MSADHFTWWLLDWVRPHHIVVKVGALKTLNLRPEQLLIDPEADLTRVRRPYLPPADWIDPLEAYREEDG